MSSRGNRATAVVAVCASAAVVIAAAVTGYLVVGGGNDRDAPPRPAVSTSTSTGTETDDGTGTENPRAGGDLEPLVPGWQVVSNAKRGIAFDVPRGWRPQASDWVTYVADERDPEDTPLVAVMAPAEYRADWCGKEGTPLATAGSRGESGKRNTEEAASRNAEQWVFGYYTQPDRDKVEVGEAKPYTTESGLKGTVVTARSTGARESGPGRGGKCATEGTATAFAFKDAQGDISTWTFIGATGVNGAVDDVTVRKVLRTVRLLDDPEGGRAP